MQKNMYSRGKEKGVWGTTLLLIIMAVVVGCASGNKAAQVAPAPDESILRIGVSTNYPPLIYKQGEDVIGVEADLARELAAHLGKKPVFVEVAWSDQIDKLVAGETDIIMAGMSVTEARMYKINFSKAYFKTGQMALIGNKPQFQYLNNLPALRAQVVAMRVGVVKGTTGEIFVAEYLNMANAIVRLETSAEAVQQLKDHEIDMLVYDGVAVLMLEKTHQADGFKKIPLFLTDEYLAWGVNKNDPELLKSANDFLDETKRNGKLKEILSRWIPNISDLK